MDERSMDVLLVYSSQNSQKRVGELVYYVTNYTMLGPDALVILPRLDEPTLLISVPWDIERARRRFVIGNVRPSSDFSWDIKEILDGLKLSTGCIGIAGLDQMYPLLFGAIERRLPGARLVNATSMLNELLLVKSEMEIELMRKCGECATAGIEAAVAFAKPGMTEVELFAEIEYAVHAKGSEDPGMCLIGSAPRGESKYGWNDPVGIKERIPTMRRLERGDVICLEITPFYKGYLLQKLRNVVLGPITPELRKTWNVFLEAHHRGIDAIRAGVTCRSVADSMNDVFLAAGYPLEMTRPPYFRVRGHGQGLGLSVPPGSLDGNDTILRERTVIVIHPSQFLPIEGGYMYRTLGDTFVVRKDKAEHITAPLEPEIFQA